MTTDIRGIKTIEEYISSANISYLPSILAIPNKILYPIDVSKITFKEHKIEKDTIDPSYLTSEMTEINVAKVRQLSHSFIPYAKGIKLRKDNLQNSSLNIQPMHDDIIRELSIQWDRLAMVGEAGNNGLISSSDSNVITPSSAEIPAISGDGFNQIQKAKEIAINLNLLVNDYTASTSLTVYFYGSDLLKFLGKITAGQETDVRKHIIDAFAGKQVNFVDISALALPSSLSLGNGIIVVSNDLTTLEHCGLPNLVKQGVNDEDDYYWSRYYYGSVQVRPRTAGAVIKQAITFAS
jgi:hypothetical protein